MPLTLPIKDMTVEEKIQAMEALWEDLSRNVENFKSPEWHGEVLEARQKLVESGQAEFIDWDQAKIDIRKRVS